MKILKSLFLLLPILFLASCSRNVYVTVDSYVDLKLFGIGFKPDTSFYVSLNTKGNEMLAKEITNKISMILVRKGFNVVDNELAADYILFYNFGMEKITETVNVSKYLPGKTQETKGKVGEVGYQEKQTEGKYVYVHEDQTFFYKYIDITVFDFRKKRDSLWQVKATVYDQFNDLREDIDYMFLMAFKYFGKNTNKKISKNLGGDSKEFKEFVKIWY